MPTLEVEGKFKVHPVGRGIRKAQTGTIGVEITFFVTDYYDPVKCDWIAWSSQNLMLEHTFWIYRTDNTPIQFNIDALKKALGWSGNFLDFEETNPWKMLPCEIETQNETYKGKTRLRVKWLNPPGGGSGGGRITERSQLEEIQRRLSGQEPPPQQPIPMVPVDPIPF